MVWNNKTNNLRKNGADFSKTKYILLAPAPKDNKHKRNLMFCIRGSNEKLMKKIQKPFIVDY